LLEGDEAGLKVGGGDQVEEIDEGEVEGAGEVGEGRAGGEEGLEEITLVVGREG